MDRSAVGEIDGGGLAAAQPTHRASGSRAAIFDELDIWRASLGASRSSVVSCLGHLPAADVTHDCAPNTARAGSVSIAVGTLDRSRSSLPEKPHTDTPPSGRRE
jgi:hypothetical protein